MRNIQVYVTKGNDVLQSLIFLCQKIIKFTFLFVLNFIHKCLTIA